MIKLRRPNDAQKNCLSGKFADTLDKFCWGVKTFWTLKQWNNEKQYEQHFDGYSWLRTITYEI